jgi:hypothetical protein
VSNDPSEPKTCQCFVALPSGATGPCGKPARWLVSGAHVRPHYQCEECKRDTERQTARWRDPPTFEELP